MVRSERTEEKGRRGLEGDPEEWEAGSRKELMFSLWWPEKGEGTGSEGQRCGGGRGWRW